MAKASALRSGEEPAALDRRRSERVELVVRVEYRSVDELFSDFARNVNEGGLFVETDTPPALGTRVELLFRLPGHDEPLRTAGTVVRVSSGGASDPPGMGIEFEEPDSDAHGRIDELVRRLRVSAPS